MQARLARGIYHLPEAKLQPLDAGLEVGNLGLLVRLRLALLIREPIRVAHQPDRLTARTSLALLRLDLAPRAWKTLKGVTRGKRARAGRMQIPSSRRCAAGRF